MGRKDEDCNEVGTDSDKFVGLKQLVGMLMAAEVDVRETGATVLMGDVREPSVEVEL